MTTLIVAGAQQLGSALIKTAGSAALSFATMKVQGWRASTSRRHGTGRPCRMFMAVFV